MSVNTERSHSGRPANAGRIIASLMVMYYVYILISLKDKKFYVGSSEDLVRRIDEHKKGKVKSTKNRLPIGLLCYESYYCRINNVICHSELVSESSG